MDSYTAARNLRIILVIIISVVAIAGLVAAARYVFFPTDSSKNDTSETSLLSTSANRSVKMSVRGSIVANENFRSYQIEITPNERLLTTYSGYMGQATQSISLGNNIPAYEQFVYALNEYKFMRAIEFSGTANDTRGVCPTGLLYEFEILKDDKTIKKLWTTSCSGGSFIASVASVKSLFTNQIPKSMSVIGKLW